MNNLILWLQGDFCYWCQLTTTKGDAGVCNGGDVNDANPIEPDAEPTGGGQKHVPSRTVNILGRVEDVLKNTLHFVRS